MYTILGKQIRKEREKQGHTAQTIALTCGTSRSYITLIESGKRLPGKRILPKIAAALKIDTSVVLHWYLEDVKENIKKIAAIEA